jgi:hypothetical protein
VNTPSRSDISAATPPGSRNPKADSIRSVGSGSCAWPSGRDIPRSREMSRPLQPGVAVPEKNTGGSARTPLETLRGVTRSVATAETRARSGGARRKRPDLGPVTAPRRECRG